VESTAAGRYWGGGTPRFPPGEGPPASGRGENGRLPLGRSGEGSGAAGQKERSGGWGRFRKPTPPHPGLRPPLRPPSLPRSCPKRSLRSRPSGDRYLSATRAGDRERVVVVVPTPIAGMGGDSLPPSAFPGPPLILHPWGSWWVGEGSDPLPDRTHPPMPSAEGWRGGLERWYPFHW